MIKWLKKLFKKKPIMIEIDHICSTCKLNCIFLSGQYHTVCTAWKIKKGVKQWTEKK